MTSKDLLVEKNIYLTNDIIENISCEIGFIQKIMPLGVPLNIFIILGEVNTLITNVLIEKFSFEGLQYAKKQTIGHDTILKPNIIAVSVLIGDDIDQSAIDFCQGFSSFHWAAHEIPAVYHRVNKKLFRFMSFRIWGFIFYLYYFKIVRVLEKSLSKLD